jgi:glyoxylase I family protein
MQMSIRQANSINIGLIDHIVIRVNDLEKMVDWYCNVLGFRLERGPGEIGLAQLRAGDSLVDLVDATGSLGRQTGSRPDPEASNMDHVCLQMQPWDAEAICTHLRIHDVEVGEVVTRYGALGNGPSLYIHDPEGNTLELKGS